MKKFIVINLNQDESRESKLERWRERSRWMIVGSYGLVLAFFCVFALIINTSYNSMIDDKEQQIEDVQKEIERLRHVGKNLSKDDILGLAELENQRILWAYNLQLLGEMTPDDMAITGLKYVNNKLIIDAIAVIYEDQKEFDIVNTFVSRLRENDNFADSFKRIRFSNFVRQDFRGQDIVQFQVEASLKMIKKSAKKLAGRDY